MIYIWLYHYMVKQYTFLRSVNVNKCREEIPSSVLLHIRECFSLKPYDIKASDTYDIISEYKKS